MTTHTRPSKIALALLLGVTLALAASVATAQDKDPKNAGAVLDGIQNFYRSTLDYQARFEQVYTDVAAGDSRTSGGRVFFKKPGKMRWDYLKKNGAKTAQERLIVSDGAAITIYEPKLKQYFRQCLKNSQLPTALRFLMGEGDLGKDFTPKLTKSGDAALVAIELTPKKTSGQYKKLVFYADASTYEVREVLIYDPYGNTNRMIFKKALINKKLPDAGFSFTPPADARVAFGKQGTVTCK